jgi:hypothetical protein
MVYAEKCYPKFQSVYLANYVMTDKSQNPEIFSLPSAD